jgi:hypothetical protein
MALPLLDDPAPLGRLRAARRAAAARSAPRWASTYRSPASLVRLASSRLARDRSSRSSDVDATGGRDVRTSGVVSGEEVRAAPRDDPFAEPADDFLAERRDEPLDAAFEPPDAAFEPPDAAFEPDDDAFEPDDDAREPRDDPVAEPRDGGDGSGDSPDDPPDFPVTRPGPSPPGWRRRCRRGLAWYRGWCPSAYSLAYSPAYVRA